MQYTTLGKTGLEVSRLGFGCMRLPMTEKDEVDREKAIPMLHRAYDLGVNLYDTAVFYCQGDSQCVVGEAFEGRREEVVLSTKNHHYDKNDPDGWWEHLENSLERLRTDYIDIYNHHGLNFDKYQNSVEGEGAIYEQMQKAKGQGLIRHICFSFHGPNEQLMKLVDTGRYDTVILQYNLLDRHLEEGIAHAAESGMGVLVMGPVGGGRLGYPSDKAASLVGEVKSTPDLALRFVLSNPNVSLALSGMSTMQMVEENAETVSDAGELSDEDFRQINEAIEERKKLSGLYCTGCNYCMPCPAGVDIPANFEILNLERVFGLTEHAREKYSNLQGKAALCRLCGKCLEPCPQEIDIPARLSEAVEVLDERAGNVMGWAEVHGGYMEEGSLRLKLCYNVKNFTEEEKDVRVDFRPHGEDQVWPQSFEVEGLRGYGRKNKRLEMAVPRYAEAYNLDAVVTYDDVEQPEHHSEMVLAAERVEEHALDASEHRSGTTHVPNAVHPIHASKKDAGGRNFDFSVCADEDNLYVYADVEDDLSAGGESGDPTHFLRVYVDGRYPHLIGRGKYEKGVAHVTLTPSDDGTVEVSATNDAEVEAACELTGTGYRVECAIPLDSFVQLERGANVIGVDISLHSSDSEGEVLKLNWTGRANGHKDASVFGKMVLV
jgi:hypothetical protein